MDKRIYIRVPEQLLEEFDRACKANYTTKSEVLRRAMLEYVRGNKKEAAKMKKIEVVIIEAGIDYTSRLESFMMNVTGGDEVEKAIAEVEKKGYKVIPNDDGGCNEYVSVTDGEDYIAVTVAPDVK
jgi:metal-responsive CopG/Arc/MetJ family transcriptional regulator